MDLFIFIIVILLVIVSVLFVFIYFKNKSFGSLSGSRIYSDTQEMPGDVMYSDSLKLKGKPDYIIKKGNEYIPVEVKTGKTPHTPYQNHIVQLIAYCVLIEENYSSIPKYGVIKYPEREFSIEYTELRKKSLEQLLSEMRKLKGSGVEPTCKHPEHNR